MSPEWVGAVSVAAGAVLGTLGTLLSNWQSANATLKLSGQTEAAAERERLRQRRRELYSETLNAATDAWIWAIAVESGEKPADSDRFSEVMVPLFGRLTELHLEAPAAVADLAEDLAIWLRDAAANLFDDDNDKEMPVGEYAGRRSAVLAAMRHDLVEPSPADLRRTEDTS